MPQRSWLFTPGDNERKLSKVAACGADVVVIDLEDAVAEYGKVPARGLAAEWLVAHRGSTDFQRFVRINSLTGHEWRDDLASVIAGGPDGIMVPKVGDAEELRTLAAELYEAEQRHSIAPGSTRIFAQLAESAHAALAIPQFAQVEMPRLCGLTWGAEDLARDLRASRQRDEAGEWSDTFRMVRANLLLAARALGIAPIDTMYSDFRDLDGLKLAAQNAFADGFAGMLAIHPDQVAVINTGFSPSAEQLAQAQEIVDLFAANPDAGALSLGGRMVEKPHLEQAQRMLKNAP